MSPRDVDAATTALGEVVVNPRRGHERHVHENSDEVLYVIEGHGVQTVADSEFPVGPGDAVWVPRGTPHSTFNTGWKPLRLIATYVPGGAEEALRELPDFVELAPGEQPAPARTSTADGESSPTPPVG